MTKEQFKTEYSGYRSNLAKAYNGGLMIYHYALNSNLFFREIKINLRYPVSIKICNFLANKEFQKTCVEYNKNL